jgi:hypothetical protein
MQHVRARATKGRTSAVNFRVTAEDRRILDQIAKHHGVHLSELLRQVTHVLAIAWRRDGSRMRTAAEQLAETIASAVKAAAAEQQQQEQERR